MANDESRKLFVAGLPDSVTEEVLRGLFMDTGAQISELSLPKDRVTGRPRGFAFVRLGTPEEAERARQDLDGRIVDGKMISVRPFQAEPPGGRAARTDGGGGAGGGPPRAAWSGPREGGGGPPAGGGGGGAASPDRTLYVGNLPYDTTPEEIETLLTGAGVEQIVRVYLPMDQDGRKRGFGFVTLGSSEAAVASIDQLKGAELRSRRLIINIAHPKGERPPRDMSGPPGGGGFSGGGGGFSGGAPRSFGGPPAGGAGLPPNPRSGKGEGRRRKFEGGEGGAGGAGKPKDREEENWRDREDDDW